MSISRRTTVQGAANAAARAAEKDRPQYRFQQRQKWALEAKAAGYPLCVQCNEPLPKQDWERKDHLCRFCRELNAKTY